MNAIVNQDDVNSRIIALRNQQVILDRDVAELYGVETKRVNEAVRNNPDKFPFGYIFELDKYEKKELVEKIDRFKPLKHSAVAPTAFTERGLYMLATILKSPQATQTTIAIIDTFVKVREMVRTMEAIQSTADAEHQKVLLGKSGEMLADVIGENLSTSSTKTEIELNFALIKIKHTFERTKGNKD